MKKGTSLRKTLVSGAFIVSLFSGPAFGENAHTFYNRGNDALQDGRLNEAVTAFSQAVRLRPDYLEALNDRGLALCELGRYSEAELDFRAAVRLNPNHETANNNLGLLLLKQGSHDESLTYLNRALVLSDGSKPCHRDILNNLSVLFEEWGMLEEATEARYRAGRIEGVEERIYTPGGRGQAPPAHQRTYSQSIGNDRLTLKFYRP